MSSLDDTRSVERQRFFDGQRLFAADLQRIEEFNREMRWLHNESLHQPGVGNGFAVVGHKGDREVVVGAGYAIDDLGREIVLTGSRTIPVQPVAGDPTGQPQSFVLTVQYPDDDDLEEVERREGICGTRGAVRLREEPIFCWVALNPDGSPADDQVGIVTGRRLVLAEVAVRDCKLDRDVGFVQRRNARPQLGPHIACGVEAPTRWEEWDPWKDADGGPEGTELPVILGSLYQLVGGLQAEIDTRSAGFPRAPGYFARIDGERTFTIDVGSEGEPQTFTAILDGQLSIVEPAAAGFRVQVLVLAFTGNRRQVGPGPVLGILGPPAGGEPDVSASTPNPPAALAEAAAVGEEGGEGGEDREPPTLVELVTGVWNVGWMGVEQ